MITDDQGIQILKKMDEQFKEMNTKMDEGFKKIDERFEKVDERLEKVDERLGKVEERLEKLDKKLDVIEMYVANHDNALKALPTRVEFEKHQEENLNFQYAVAKKLEMKRFAKA